ncbi:hypothetical protein YC2023_108728 [Brassica napus]
MCKICAREYDSCWCKDREGVPGAKNLLQKVMCANWRLDIRFEFKSDQKSHASLRTKELLGYVTFSHAGRAILSLQPALKPPHCNHYEIKLNGRVSPFFFTILKSLILYCHCLVALIKSQILSMCLPISYPEDRKDVGELEKLLRSDLPDAKRMYRRCTQEKRPSLSQEWPVVRGMDQGV